MQRNQGPAVTNEPNDVKAVLNEPGKILTNEAGSLFAISPAPSDGLVLTSDSSVDGGLGWVSVTGVAGVGDVNGPASSAATAIARFTDTSGKQIQSSPVLLSVAGAMTGVSSLAVGTANVSGSVNASNASATNLCVQTAVDGDTHYRFGVTNSGSVNMSSGTAVPDVRIRRTGTSAVQIDNGSSGAASLSVDSITATTISSKPTADLVTGPANATDNAIARYDNTTGKVLQGSLVTVSDTGDIAGANSLSVGSITATSIGGKTVANIITAAASTGTADRLTRWSANQVIKDSNVILNDGGHISGVASVTATSFIGNLTGNASNATAVGGVSVIGTPSTGQVLKATSSSVATWQPDTTNTGDVVGPASSTTNAVVRFDGTSGKSIKSSGIVIDDSDSMSGVTAISSAQYNSPGILLLQPALTSAIQANSTGAARGNYATDWQRQATNDHVASGLASTIGGGSDNSATADYATVAGGSTNWATGTYSTISGGKSGRAAGPYSTVAGGIANEAHFHYSTVSGGNGNKIGPTGTGIASVIIGGFHSTIVHDGCMSFNGNVSGSATSSANYQAIFNLLNAQYTPPAEVEKMFINGGLDVTGDIKIGGSLSVSTLYTTLVTPSTTNTTLTLEPTGTGALQANDSGNARGLNAVDWQIASPSPSTAVASGSYSTISGGSGNTASAASSVIGGGGLNQVGGQYATVCGGLDNIIATGCTYSTVAGGNASRVNHGSCLVYGGQAGVTTTGTRQILFNCGASMYTAPSTNPGVYTNGAITCAGLYVPPPSGGTSTLLTDYETGTFNVTTFGAISGQTVQVKFQRLGKQVTLQIDAFAQNVTSTGNSVSLSTVPARLRPVTQFAAIIQTRNGDVAYVGHMQVATNGLIAMYNGPTGGDRWDLPGVACGTYSATTLTYMTA